MSSEKIITSILRKWRWSAEDKRAMVEESELPGMFMWGCENVRRQKS